MKQKDYHVISRGNKWALKLRSAKRATRLFKTRDEAVQYYYDKLYTSFRLCIHEDSGSVAEVL